MTGDIARADDYQTRLAEARERLTELLDPKTEQEQRVAARLTQQLDLEGLTVMAELVEYRRDR